MTRDQLIRALGDIVALVLSAALIIATIVAINTRVASAADEVYQEDASVGKHVEESFDSPAPCEYVLARVETPDGEIDPCATEEEVAKWIVPWVDLGDCSEGGLWLVEYAFEEFEANDGCLSAETSLQKL